MLSYFLLNLGLIFVNATLSLAYLPVCQVKNWNKDQTMRFGRRTIAAMVGIYSMLALVLAFSNRFESVSLSLTLAIFLSIDSAHTVWKLNKTPRRIVV